MNPQVRARGDPPGRAAERAGDNGGVSKQGGRYQRTFPGLIGALLVTLVVIAAFVATRALTRDQVEVEPDRVNLASAVDYATSRGVTVVRPGELPEGWFARDVTLQAGDDPVWSLDLLTDEERYVGIHQESTSVSRLVARLVDPEAEEEGRAPVRGPLRGAVDQWRVFSDAGGDVALVGELDHPSVPEGQVLVVVGTAGEATIRELATGLELASPAT